MVVEQGRGALRVYQQGKTDHDPRESHTWRAGFLTVDMEGGAAGCGASTSPASNHLVLREPLMMGGREERWVVTGGARITENLPYAPHRRGGDSKLLQEISLCKLVYSQNTNLN